MPRLWRYREFSGESSESSSWSESSAEDSDGAVVVKQADVRDFNEANILPQSPATLKRIRRWLRPMAYDAEDSEYRKNLALHLEGTGSWLLSHGAYQNWRSSSEQGLLWIRGGPGTGKSVLAASFIRQLEIEGSAVLYFLFRQAKAADNGLTAADNGPTVALRALLHQLLVFSPPLQLRLENYVHQRGGIDALSQAELWQHLRQGLLHLPKVFCIFDALDGMEQTGNAKDFLSGVAELAQYRPEQVKVMVTGRPDTFIEQPLTTTKSLQIQLDENPNEDIQKVVSHRLGQSNLPSETQTLIKDTVLNQADAVFLYTKLAMDAVLQPGADAVKVLHELPRQDLNSMYSFLLRQHTARSGISEDVQLLVMAAVTHSTHPLCLAELAELTAVALGQQPIRKADLEAAKEIVRSTCGSLLKIQRDKTVAVAHHTLTEFLTDLTRRRTGATSYHVLQPGATHERLAVVCLSYLLAVCLAHVVSPFPFAEYAAGSWPAHARKAALAGHNATQVNGLLDRLLQTETLYRWVRLLPRQTEPWWDYCARVTPLLVAAALGLTSYVKLLLDNGIANVNEGENLGSTPLLYAAKRGFDDVVELLLKAGASTSLSTEDNGTPLLQAVRQDHPKVVRLLIEAGDDAFREVELYEDVVEEEGSEGVSPATLACERGQLEVMTALLPCIKTSEQANRLLSVSASSRRLEIIKLLLQHPLTQINAKFDGHTPLLSACQDGDTQSAQLLLEAGADPNILHDDITWGDDSSNSDAAGEELQQGDTALTALARSADRRGHGDWVDGGADAVLNCFEKLLEAGAQVNMPDSDGQTALYHVQNARIARLLLDAGADPDATDGRGGSILHSRTNKDVLQVVLQYTSSSSLERRQASNGQTPLLGALADHNMELALELLALGARGTVVDNEGNGVFHHAADSFAKVTDSENYRPRHRPSKGADWSEPPTVQDFQDLLHRLRKAGGNIHSQNQHGRTALHVLVGGLHAYGGGTYSREALEALLAAGADLEARDSEGQTALFLRAQLPPREEYARGLEMLLEAGADPSTRDGRGRTVFHACIHNRELAFLEVLAMWGADPALADYQGNTLWHEQAAHISRMLLPRDLALATFLLPQDDALATTSPLLQRGHDAVTPLLPLIQLNVSVTAANNSGRTPLHVVASFAPGNTNKQLYSRRDERPKGTGLEYLIQHFKTVGVDQVDSDGVTALHLAATHSEFNTRCIVDAGADAKRATSEGLTPLHLAARSRKPNIVGMLLDALKSASSPEELKAVVNAKDVTGAMPLHYACVSGEAESVRLLIEAGACVDVQDGDMSGDMSPWHSCLGFEDEEHNWPEPVYRQPDLGQPDARAVLLHDMNRGKEAQQSTANSPPRERLDDILQLLLASSSPSAAVMDDAISRAAQRKLDYTVECLSRIREAMPAQIPEIRDPAVDACLQRRDAQRKANDDRSRRSKKSREQLRFQYSQLMRIRDFDAAAGTFQNQGGIGVVALRDLVHRGHASVLQKLATEETMAQLNSWDQERKARPPEYRGGRPRGQAPEPLLLAACEVEVPNMAVVRLLVDEVNVNVNARRTIRSTAPSPRGGNAEIEDDGALHLLAMGSHWWQTALALPYLVEHGADIELLDSRGLTPLLRALDQVKHPTFKRQGVDVLVALGANVNAADARGVTCLARASSDVAVTRLLLEHGAAVTHSAMAAAIQNEQPATLQLLLEYGGDPNGTQTAAESKAAAAEAARAPSTGTPPAHERFPLDLAAIPNDSFSHPSPILRHELITTLLSHGADPNAAYPYHGTTLLHRLLADGRFAHILLTHPSATTLNLESLNTYGNTLLLIACLTCLAPAPPSSPPRPSPAQHLLDLGANPRARSTTSGRTALHALVAYPGRRVDIPTLQRIATTAPELLSAVDAHGRTALRVLAETDTGSPGVLALVRAMPDVGSRDDMGSTALHALLRGRWTVGRRPEPEGWEVGGAGAWAELLRRGVDVHARDGRRETALWGYVRHAVVVGDGGDRGDLWRPRSRRRRSRSRDRNWWEPVRDDGLDAPVFALFAAAGMDFGTVNDRGESLLHAAAAGRNGARFRLLLERGLDPDRIDAGGRTAIDVAASVGARDILGLCGRDTGGGSSEESESGRYSSDWSDSAGSLDERRPVRRSLDRLNRAARTQEGKDKLYSESEDDPSDESSSLR